MRFVFMIVPKGGDTINFNTVTTYIQLSEDTTLLRIDIDSEYFSKNVRTSSWYDASKIILDVTSVREGDTSLLNAYAEKLARDHINAL